MEIQKLKTVMVSYLERNKLLKIPDSAESDLKFLTEVFRREFKFDLVVTFQRFDSEWGEYIDLEVDSSVCHKDKLKVIVTPLLVTPATSDYTETALVSRYVII